MHPPARRRARNDPAGERSPLRTPEAESRALLLTPAGELRPLRLEPVTTRRDSLLWNDYVDRYHHRGYQPLPGARPRWFARDDQGLPALLGFGAAAWKTAPRDDFIGWGAQRREARLHLVANNARFLIPARVRSRCLASKLLALAARRLPVDWEQLYGRCPALLETFVQQSRVR